MLLVGLHGCFLLSNIIIDINYGFHSGRLEVRFYYSRNIFRQALRTSRHVKPSHVAEFFLFDKFAFGRVVL